jgi:hypothetical protein
MCPTPPTGRHIVPMHPLEPSGGGGATAHSGLKSYASVYYAPIDMAILQNVFHRISCARINRRNRRNRPCMETNRHSCMADRREAAAAPAQAARHVRGVDDDTRAAACHIARCCPSDSSC